jgi:hypothetical protein
MVAVLMLIFLGSAFVVSDVAEVLFMSMVEMLLRFRFRPTRRPHVKTQIISVIMINANFAFFISSASYIDYNPKS